MIGDPEKQKSMPKRGRPALSEDEFSGRRAEIAAVALQLFKEEGFASVSMRRLGKEVGLTPMALYRYFPSKLEILSILWSYILGEAFNDVAIAVYLVQGPEDKLRSASNAYVGYWFRSVEHYQLVFMNSGITNTDVTSFVSQGSVVDAYEVFFENMAQALKLPRSHEQVKTSTDSLVCHLHGIMHSLITMQGYDWTARESLVELAVANAIGH
ncbi:TetR/AcrR family transcriptional regulator [Ruegeria hyattellae]|uniref:TetR/AcrR family transcriptional regulator n=1 Tax=Ruegeria hyattellae TaxID=3233337 RepID=UPI00355C632D